MNLSHVYCGWMIDGTGGPVRKKVLLEIEEGQFRSVQWDLPDAESQFKDGPLMDLSEGTAVPTLVDSHVHLTMTGENNPALRDHQLHFTYEEARTAIDRHVAQHLEAGIFAVRDGGDSEGHTLRYCLERHRREQLQPPAPVIKSAGRAWHAAGRYGKLIGRVPREGERLADGIRKDTGHCDHIKIVNSGLNSLKTFGRQTAPQFDFGELHAAFEIARQRGLPVMTHANGQQAVREAVMAGCSSIEHGFFMGRDNLMLMRDRRTFWVPTAITMKAYARELPEGSLESDMARRNFDHQMEQIMLARELGVPIALGTDSGSLGVHHGRSLSLEFQILLTAGFSLPQAIEAGSYSGARLLGIERQMGRITSRMPANFLWYRCKPEALAENLHRPDKRVVLGHLV